MNSKTLFSKSIIKSDFKRYWWISAIYTLLIAFGYTFMVFTDVLNYTSRYHTDALHIYVDSTSIMLLSFIIPVVLGAVLFSYLQKGKNVTFFHSLPLSRKTLFLSHVFSGLVMFILPLLINLAATWLVIKGFGVENYTSNVTTIFECIYGFFIYGTLLFCLSALVSSFMGNTIASFLFTYVFYFLLLAIEGFLYGFAGEMLYGFAKTSTYISEKLYFFDNPCTLRHLLVYLAISVVLLIAGYFVYKKRNLENHSEIVAFPKLKIIFIMGCGLTFGAIGYMYFLNMVQVNTTLTFIPFGLIGVVISSMISAKSFKVPKIYKPVCIFLGLVLVLFLVFDLDIFGYETYVPEADKVESVTFEHYGGNLDMHWYNPEEFVDGEWIYYYDDCSPTTTNPETIKKICTLHKNIIPEEKYYNASVKLTYKLKSGITVSRYYDYNWDCHIEEYRAIIDSDLKAFYFPVLRDNNVNYRWLTVFDTNSEYKLTLTTEEQTKEFMEALKKDIQAASSDQLLFPDNRVFSIELNLTRPAHFKDGTPVTKLPDNIIRYDIYGSYENTLKLLEKYNVK